MSDEKSKPPLPRTDRVEPPAYLARFLANQQAAADAASEEQSEDADVPIYLRQFRQRATEVARPALPPLYERVGLGMQRAMSEANRNKEIVAPAKAKKAVANDVYLVRHAETQGYSTEAGITPLGTWQSHTYGHTLAKRLKDGETVVIRSARTNRAGQTAEQIHRGLLDGIGMFERDVKVFAPEGADEFRNFGVATPEGVRDITAAFRKYYSILEQFERTALGERPMWLVEVDRFWRTQEGGGDPIEHWLRIPMLHFEPPAMCVRRFWIGIQRLAAEYPNARLIIPTHSGPIRAFATSALGYDPGEPYNTEHVRIKLYEDGDVALVSYRNRVQEVHVPDVERLPMWSLDEDWVPR